MMTINLVSTKKCRKGLHKYPAAVRQCPRCECVAQYEWAEANKDAIAARRVAYSAAYYAKHKSLLSERKKARRDADRPYDREGYVKRKYGIDAETHARILNSQGLNCAACLERLGPDKLTHIDHCHATGRVRGILCSGCNKSLGLMKESPEKIRALAAYIERLK